MIKFNFQGKNIENAILPRGFEESAESTPCNSPAFKAGFWNSQEDPGACAEPLFYKRDFMPTKWKSVCIPVAIGIQEARKKAKVKCSIKSIPWPKAISKQKSPQFAQE
jgi:hypothetical protein